MSELYEFKLFRDDTVNAARVVDPDDRDYMLQAFAELRDLAEPQDEIVLILHADHECMCPDELGLRTGCVQLSSVVIP